MTRKLLLQAGKLSIAASLFLPLVAGATNGYFSHGVGIKAQGLAGAGIALPQDGLTAATNPAGTAFVGNRLDIGATFFAPSRGADITGSPVPGLNGSYDGDSREYFLIPEVGYVRQWSDSVALGIAAYGNGGMNTSYANNPFSAFGSSGSAGVDLAQLFISPSLAWKITPQHAVGIAVNFAYQRFGARGLQAFDNPVFSAHPGYVTNRGIDTSTGWGVRLGWTGQITPDLTLGATWSSKIKTSELDKYQGLFANGGNFDVPENYGIGAAYKLSPATTVALDFQNIQYSSVVSVGNPVGNPGLTPLGSRNGSGFGWKDVDVVKLGVSHDVNKDLTLRAGISHVTQPVPQDQTLFNILAPGVVQNHLSVGATWQTAGGELSLAYSHAFKKSVKGKGSLAIFGGGEVDVNLKENIFGVSYGWKL